LYKFFFKKGKWALFAVFCRFSPFSGCFCYNNFFNTGRIPDFARNHNPKSSGAPENPEESFFGRKKSQKN